MVERVITEDDKAAWVENDYLALDGRLAIGCITLSAIGAGIPI